MEAASDAVRNSVYDWFKGSLMTRFNNPAEGAVIEGKDSSPAPTEGTKPLSDAAEFRQALLGVPFPLELDF